MLGAKRNRGRGGAWAAAALVSAVVLSAAQPVLGQAAEKTADEYALEGRELAARNDFQGAYAAYMEAWKRKRSFDIAGNLGVAELRLGRMREAAEHLTYCEQNYPAVRDAEQTKKLEVVRELLKEARAQVGVARIRVTRDDGGSAAGAGVFVDGRPVGRVEEGGRLEQPLLLLSPEVFVDPGSRTFSASLPGCEDAVTVLAVPKGGAVDAGLMLSCRRQISWPLVIAGASVAAAGIGVGIGTAVHSGARSADADAAWVELYDKEGGAACRNPANLARCNDIVSGDEDWRLYRGIAIGSFVVAGAAATATLIYVLVGGSSPAKKDAGIQAGVAVLPGGGSAVVRGSF